MTYKMLVTTVKLVLAVGLLAACAGGKDSALTVEVKEFQFSPANLEVVAGQPVKLVLKNTGSLEHDFSVMDFPLEGEAEEAGAEHDMAGMAEEPDLHVAALGGQSGSLEFTPTKPGTYEYFCTVSGHKDAGMTGSLVVRAP